MTKRIGTALVGLAIATLEARAGAQSPPAAPETFKIGDFTLTPTMEVRARGEYRHDPVDLGGRDLAGVESERIVNSWFVMERTRLGLGAERGPVAAQITLQDAHAWGQSPVGVGTQGDPAGIPGSGFLPYEAYAEAHTSSARPSYLRIGRQAVMWGDGRLLGTSDWSPTGRSLDAIRGSVPVGTMDLEVLAAVLSPPSPTFFTGAQAPESTGTQLYGVHLGWSLDPLLRIEGTGLARVSRTGGGDSRFAIAANLGETYVGSLRVSGDGRGWKYTAQGAFEFGTAREYAVDRAAYAVGGSIAHTFDNLVWTPTVSIGGSYASGDDGVGAYKQFDPIFAEVHAFYGVMDIFTWSNILEANARVQVLPFALTQFALEYRYARLPKPSGEWLNGYLNPIGRARGNDEAELGHELDATFAWQPWAPLDLRAGYGMLFLGDGARSIMAAQARGATVPGNPTTYAPSSLSEFAYVQVTVLVP